MRPSQVILEEARTIDKMRHADNQVIHGDMLAVLEVSLDMRKLLMKIEEKT